METAAFLLLILGLAQTAPLPHPLMVPAPLGENITLHCHANSVGTPERVTWDEEDGSLIQARKSLTIKTVSQPYIFICRRRNLAHRRMAFGTILVTPQCVRAKAVTPPGYLPSLHVCLRPGQRLSVVCTSSAQDPASAEWTGPENTPVGSENLLTRAVKGEEDFGKYQCMATDERGRVWRRQVEVMNALETRRSGEMMNEPASQKGRTTWSVFILKPPSRHYQEHVLIGSRVIIKCPLDQRRREHRLVRWFFKNRPRNATYTSLSLSAMVIPSAKEADTGRYECRIGNSSKEINLRVTNPVILRIHPDALPITWNPEVDQKAEIHCLVRFYKSTADDVEWRFRPARGGPYQLLPSNVIVKTDRSQTNSFLVFHPLRLEHAGTYMCRLPLEPTLGSVKSRLTIRLPRSPVGRFPRIRRDRSEFISLSPTTTTAAPTTTVSPEPPPTDRLMVSPPIGVLSGCINKTSVSALCWVESKRFTPRWRNKRTHSIDGRKETLEVLTGNRLRLQLQDFTFDDDRKEFECYSDSVSPDLWKTVTLRVTKECDHCQCSPNQFRCESHSRAPPYVSCANANWRCDGEDDCGNGFDENLCSARVDSDMCRSSYFVCADSTSIPKGFWCDGEVDCKNGEDERSCKIPTVTWPTSVQRRRVRLGDRVSLKCVARGVPPPTVVWRYNWDCVPPNLQSQCQCRRTDGFYEAECELVIPGIRRENLGAFTCEAINSAGRNMAEDYILEA